MKMISSAVLLAILSTTLGSNLTVSVFPEKGYGIEGQAYEVQANLENGAFETCTFTSRQNVTLSTNGDILQYWENREKTSCKMIITQMNNYFKGYWDLILTFADQDPYNVSFSIGMNSRPTFETELYATAVSGDSLRISCADLENLVYVKIINPSNILVTEGTTNSLYIPYVTKQDEGIWKCKVLLEYFYSEVEVNINVRVVPEKEVITSVTETDEQVIVSCIHSEIGTVSCIFESPNETIIAVYEGMKNGRFSYSGKDISKECGLAIEKPLEKEEIGKWKCLIASPKLAKFLDVGGSSDDKLLGSTKTPQVKSVEGTDVTVQCSLRAVLTYCYVQTQTGKVFSAYPDDLYTGRGLNIGDCQLTIPSNMTAVNDSGIWTCGMGSPGLPDVLVPIQVTIADKNFTAAESSIYTRKDKPLKLICQSALGYPLEYCRFTHPTGRGINGLDGLNDTKYFLPTKSIASGFCELSINLVENDDFGTWICAAGITTSGEKKEYQDKIIVEKDTSLSTEDLALTLGLSIGTAFLVVGTGGFFAFKRRQRRSRNHLLRPGYMSDATSISSGSTDS